jgi:hypothetical protein
MNCLVFSVETPCFPWQNLESQVADFQVKKETFQGFNSGCFGLIFGPDRTEDSFGMPN